MSDDNTIAPEIEPAGPPSQGEFAARLASRLCHDFISPASAIISGLDLLEEPDTNGLHAEALSLIANSAKKLVAMLTFARAAYGGSSAAESFDSVQLQALTQGIFDGVRPDLDWSVHPQMLEKAAGRVILHLAELGAGALPMGGTAKVMTKTENGWTAVMVESRGPRLRLDAQVAGGLRGEPPPPGPAGKWLQAYYVHNQVKEAGGVVASEQTDEKISFTVALPTTI